MAVLVGAGRTLPTLLCGFWYFGFVPSLLNGLALLFMLATRIMWVGLSLLGGLFD